MRILVTFAVEAEFAPWRERHDFHPAETCSNETVYAAKISGVDVFVGLTGIGPKAAARKICGFTRSEDHDICISSGFAGALRPEYQIGDILAAREVLGEQESEIGHGSKILSTERLLQIARDSGAKVVERFYSSASTVRTAEEKKSLSHIAEAVEMESLKVLEEALVCTREVIALRAISDLAEQDLPLDFDAVVAENGQLSMTRLAGEIMRNPTAIPGLVRLGRSSASAANRLADFFDSYIEVLAPKSLLARPGRSLTR